MIFRKVVGLFFVAASLAASGCAWAEGKDKALRTIDFSYTAFPEERQKVYETLKDDFNAEIDFRKAEKLPEYDPISTIGIDKYDLDDDGIPEVFAYINLAGFCGSHGCSFYIFKAAHNELTPLQWMGNSNSIIVHDPITLLQGKTNGYHNILFESGLITRWNGSKFSN